MPFGSYNKDDRYIGVDGITGVVETTIWTHMTAMHGRIPEHVSSRGYRSILETIPKISISKLGRSLQALL